MFLFFLVFNFDFFKFMCVLGGWVGDGGGGKGVGGGRQVGVCSSLCDMYATCVCLRSCAI